ncbi:MAG: PD-(D/E)XK nuclease family protein [Phycisphaerae bacterium]
MELAKEQRRLDAFLVDNQELESLSARLARFNLFGVLKIEKAEIRHSNVLAWLLTPGETHGLGDTFLRRFLSRLLMENDEVEVTLTPAQVELMNFNDVEVLREWRNIDIVARSRSGNWCLLIENKIHAKEKKGALLRGRKYVEEDMPTAQIIPVFLTLDGDDPSKAGQEAGFVSLSHVEVLELAERIIEQNLGRIPGDANIFLNHYLDTLRRLTMQDQELIDLCKTIYGKHREAIEMIVEFGTSSQMIDTIEEEVRTLVDSEFVVRAGRKVWFLPGAMAKLLPTVKLSAWTHLKREVAVMWWFVFWKKEGKLGLVLEVGPIENEATRRRLLNAIKKSGPNVFTVPKNAFKEGAKYTRILSKYQKLRSNEDGEPDDDPEYVKSVAKSLWTDLWAKGAKKITDVLKNFDWGGVG